MEEEFAAREKKILKSAELKLREMEKLLKQQQQPKPSGDSSVQVRTGEAHLRCYGHSNPSAALAQRGAFGGVRTESVGDAGTGGVAGEEGAAAAAGYR